VTSFNGLSIALAGLRSARRSMDVAAGNVANASNPEYARRKTVTGLTPPVPGALVQVGSEGLYLQRITDQFYEQRSLTEASAASKLTRGAEMLSDLERTVPEPSPNGIAAAMGEFFASYDEVATAAGQLPVREVAITRAADAAAAFNLASTQMSRVRDDSASRLELVVEEVNFLSGRLAGLNRSITEAAAAGNDPSAFLDDRDTTARRLSELVGAKFDAGPNGTLSATLAGSTLVFDSVSNQLSVTDTGVTLGLAWAGPAFSGPVTSDVGGEAAAYIEFANATLPSAVADLDTAAVDFMNQVNALHSSGYSQDGTTALALFVGSTAATMTVNPTVAADPAKLATGATNAPLDTSVATRIADLATASVGPLASFRSFVAGLGSQVRLSQQQAEVQVGVLSQVDTARQAARGVSVDEEIASIVEFQRAYEASAKVIQVFDTTMDALMSIVR